MNVVITGDFTFPHLFAGYKNSSGTRLGKMEPKSAFVAAFHFYMNSSTPAKVRFFPNLKYHHHIVLI